MNALGACMCGKVTFRVEGVLPDAIACHCTMCRKVTGHFLVSTEVARADLQFTKAEGLAWYQSSDKVQRGFCKCCGSTLFFDPSHMPKIAIAMGAFENTGSTCIEKHIFVADKGDYYRICDGLPQELEPPK